jgi:hypothetical protein
VDEKWTEFHPLRPPNWRWLRAVRLVELDNGCPRSDDNDSHVIAATRFYTKLNNERIELVRAQNREQYLAWKIHSDIEYERLRWELEARLIALQEDDDIGVRVSVPAKTVAYYEKWYYNVRDRANNIGYLYNQLIAPLVGKNPKETDYEMLWKFYGLKSDGNVLDSLIYGFSQRTNTFDPDSVQNFWITDYQENLNQKGAIASRLVKVDFNTYMKVLEQRVKLLEAKKETGASSITDNSVLCNIQVALEQTPWLGEKRKRDSSQIGGATLRAGELLQLGNEQPSEEFVTVLESACYPVDD